MFSSTTVTSRGGRAVQDVDSTGALTDFTFYKGERRIHERNSLFGHLIFRLRVKDTMDKSLSETQNLKSLFFCE